MTRIHRINTLKAKGLVFLLLLILPSAFSQTYYFENYSVRQGLPNSKVYDILQDEKGYFWLATPSGLSRFDGEDFVSYGLKDGINESSVRALFLDKEHRLWIGFENGEVFVKTEKTFQLIINDSINAKGEISDITQNLKGEIVITTSNKGVFVVNHPFKGEVNIQHFTGKDGIGQVIFKCETFNNGDVYFATSVDMMYMNDDTSRFHYYRPKDFPQFFLTTCFTQDRDGNIWIGKYNGGLYKYNPKTEEYLFFDHRDGLANNFVSALFQDSRGRIWAGTWGGGISLIENDKVQVNFNNKNGLSGLNIQKITEDSEGNIYIATQENGFNIFKGNQFLSIKDENGLPNMQIWDICNTSDSTVLLATNKGIAELTFNGPLKARVTNVFSQSKNGLISNKIRNLLKDEAGNIWIGTALSGIQKYNVKKKKFEYDYILNSNLPRNVKLISAIKEINNELYIGTVDGLLNYEIKTGKTIRLSQENFLSGNNISSLFVDSKKRLWVGARNKGINYIENRIITSLPKTKNITPICFTEDIKGTIWVGSFNGVYKMVGDSLIRIVDESKGLLSNYVSLIHFLDPEHLIIGSNNGLNIYDLKSGQITHYNKNLGYTGIETKNNSFAMRPDSVLLFGTTGGLMIFNPKSQDRKLIEPFIHIEEMKINMQKRDMQNNTEYDYFDNSFLFTYHGMSYSNQTDLIYQVILEGIDLGWREPTKSESISFSKLPPGDYTFKVKATTFDGISNQDPVSYHFTINPPWWKTWWFMGGSAFFLFISIFSGVQYRIYLLKKEKEILEQKVVERTIEISQKNELLAEKNKHITDSISYARRIQYATMRPEKHLNKLYENAFILYIPKDIVSGDFYWYAKRDKQLIIAAADCTGHGVPGAFMSMLGIAFLNEIVGRMNHFNAGDILQKLRSNVINALHQSEDSDSAKDGMDIALLVLDTENRTLQYSGAYNPLYIVRDKELIEYKANRMPIGVHSRDSEAFDNHSIQLQENDYLYIFTDGFADQFGGPKGKKMNYKRFKSMIMQQQGLSCPSQLENLHRAFTEWKGENEQLDDVLVIGIQV